MRFIQWLAYQLCTTCKPNRSRTVRYAYPLIFATAAVLGAAVITSQDVSYVRIESSRSQVMAGERFVVSVYAYAKEAVNAVDIALAYPDDRIEVTGIDTGESVITLWTQEPYVADGEIIMRGGTFRRGFIGEHLIAQINMRAINTGVAAFSTAGIQFLKGDGSGDFAETDITDDGQLNLYIVGEGQTAADLADVPSDTLRVTAELVVVTDVDGDGQVTLADISAFMAAWATGDRVFDFNGDGRMTFRDFGIILADSFFK